MKITCGLVLGKYPYIARLIPDNPDLKLANAFAFYVRIEKSNLLPHIVAHELTHVIQFWRNPFKWIWWQITEDQYYQIEMESEAYAVQAIVRGYDDNVVRAYAETICKSPCYKVDDNLVGFVERKIWEWISWWESRRSDLEKIIKETNKVIKRLKE